MSFSGTSLPRLSRIKGY